MHAYTHAHNTGARGDEGGGCEEAKNLQAGLREPQHKDGELAEGGGAGGEKFKYKRQKNAYTHALALRFCKAQDEWQEHIGQTSPADVGLSDQKEPQHVQVYLL